MTDEDQAQIDRDQMAKARRGRNIALGLVLLGFVVLFYAITIVRMG